MDGFWLFIPLALNLYHVISEKNIC